VLFTTVDNSTYGSGGTQKAGQEVDAFAFSAEVLLLADRVFLAVRLAGKTKPFLTL
jgi:hypothetical protein